MSSIFSQTPRPSDARLAELIKSLESPNPSDVRDDIWLCLIELQQLRAAASTPTVEKLPLSPGGDERAAARIKGPFTVRICDPPAAVPELYDDLGTACTVARQCANDCGRETYVRCVCDDHYVVVHRFYPTHPAPLSGAAHAELAPAADPAAPSIGSAVGSPGFTNPPYED